MNASKPEELVAKLYEESLSDREVKKQLEDFGLSGKEAHELMKRAKELIEKRKNESKEGEKFIEGMKDRAKALPKEEEKKDKEKKPKSSFFSGLFGSHKEKEKEKAEEEEKAKDEKKPIEVENEEGGKAEEEKREDKKGGRDGHHRDRMLKLEKLRDAISTTQPEEEATTPQEEGNEPNDEEKEPEPKGKAGDIDEEEIVKIVKREVGESEPEGGVGSSESKMDQEALDQINKKFDELQKEMGEIKQLLSLIRDLNIKVVEIVKSKEQ